MSTNEILSLDNELLILVRRLRLCRYYILYSLCSYHDLLSRRHNSLSRLYEIVCFHTNLEKKRILDIFKATAKTDIGKISKFRDI